MSNNSMSRDFTPTGIPIDHCGLCGRRHPVTRRHCTKCNRASVFLNDAGLCRNCRYES